MAREGDRQENIEVPPQVGLDFGHEGNQNDRKFKEKLFKSLTLIINFSKPNCYQYVKGVKCVLKVQLSNCEMIVKFWIRCGVLFKFL